MQPLCPVLDFAPLRTLHRERTRRMGELVSPGAPPPPGDGARQYALSHHVFEGAEAAARAGDAETFTWYRTHPDAGAADLGAPADGRLPVVLAPGTGGLVRSPVSETPYYVLGPGTRPAPAAERELTAAAAAFAAGADEGLGRLVTDHAVVLCLLRRKRLGETLDSWSITRLPGTVFCDYTDEPAVLARDLVHEAGHSWLNDALAAVHAKIDDEVRFPSPWKRAPRPAYGFLHACWSFPLMMLYTAAVLDRCSGDVRRFLRAYLDEQRELLAPTASDHAAALSLVPDAGLRDRLRTVHREALAL
ncbi:HEXXH motif-containing putative peptide modification protein [Streptomyces luteireticuli]|uniref:HEXXH motif domain-containing protein n=1 Tax=Streptomyces luteireticuli TaxID=173858 RepID=A0ABN0YJ43_9ACTN